MKELLICVLVVAFSAGCGGYGSGMGMTPAPNPVISPGPGAYSAPLTVTITDARQGATIYYTVDGSTPSLSSPIYQGPFALNQSARVEAIAAANGYSASGVTTVDYTVQ